MQKYKNKIIAAAVIICVLAAAFVFGGDYAKNDNNSLPVNAENNVPATENHDAEEIATETEQNNEVNTDNEINQANENSTATNEEASTEANEPSNEITETKPQEVAKPDVNNASQTQTPSNEGTGEKDKYQTSPVPEGKPKPVEPQDVTVTDKALTCTLSVRCDTILNNMDSLDSEKVELVPEDGVILAATAVTFYEGESVFNVLQREMKRNKIHMEFVNTPGYNSAYIEGINNLYEFDCGELSGWVYRVNGWFPNYGCSRYMLQDGDVIEWLYTCDLGRDVGRDVSGGKQ